MQDVKDAVASCKPTRSGTLPSGAKLNGLSVNNLSATALRAGFTGITADQVGGQGIEAEAAGPKVYADAVNIKPQDYDEMRTCEIGGSFTMGASVLTWVRSALNGNVESARNAALAMYDYWQCAEAYIA